jgi:hypothetical protein
LFEFYCVDTVLSNYDLSHEEILAGIVDGSKDGGIDAAYIFINRKLYTEDLVFSSLRQPIDLELHIIQAKNEDTLKEGPIDKLSASLPILLNPVTDFSRVSGKFNKNVVKVFSSFFASMKSLANQFPKVQIRTYYCSKSIGKNAVVELKASSLEQTLRNMHTDVSVSVVGAQQLYDFSSKQKRLVLQLPTQGTPLSGKNSYVALCKLTDYVKFVSDESGGLIGRLFDANVRAYQGDVEVNKEIWDSLEKPKPGLDFWWLNNGVTVVADQAQFQNNQLTIENPLIVNSLQTSNEIYKASKIMDPGDSRFILVRVVVEKDTALRDEIIRATNRQTSIKHSSFRATEQIHRELEDYFLTIGYYYDRRKNFYKREGKPVDRIISIDRLAQAVLSVLLKNLIPLEGGQLLQ